MKELKAKINVLSKQYNALAIRERVLIFLAALLALYFVWDFTVQSFFDSSKIAYSQQKTLLDTKIKSLQTEVNTFKEISGKEYVSVTQEMEAIKTEIAKLQQELSEQVKEMISPSEMRSVLRDIVDKTKGLELVSMETLPPKAITITSKTESPEKTSKETAKLEIKTINIYSHELKMEFFANYFDTLKFLESLESQKLKMFWDELTYEVIEYPKAKIKMGVHTLSLEEGWIGG